MNSGLNLIEEINSILNRYKKGVISPEFAKSELLYMIKAARNMEELRVADAACDQVSLVEKNPGDVRP